MESLQKQSGSGITFTAADGTQKSLEEHVAEEQEKEHDMEARNQQASETGHDRRRIIYRSPIKKHLDSAIEASGQVRKWTKGEINDKFGKDLFERMAKNNPPLAPLLIAGLLYGDYKKPIEMVDEIKRLNPKSKVQPNSAAAQFSSFKGSDLKYFLEMTRIGKGYAYKFPREVRLCCSAEQLYRVYLKAFPGELHRLLNKYEELRNYFKRRGFEIPPEPGVKEPVVKVKQPPKNEGVMEGVAEAIKGAVQEAPQVVPQTIIPATINVNITVTFKWGGNDR